MAKIETKEEQDLFDAIQLGKSIAFQNRPEIDADLLRHIILGLPVVKAGKARALARSVLGAGDSARACARTGVGIRIEGAVIRGRLILDAAMGQDGGPICPLEFELCWFDGGFSGRHAHFSRLSFEGCRFRDRRDRAPDRDGKETRPGDADEALPSIDLSGATIDRDLDMAAIRADGDELEAEAADRDYFDERAERDEHHCWVRLVGSRIDGNLDLSRARLRSPPDNPKRWHSIDGVNALDLSRAQVKGDVRFLNGGLARGRIMAASVEIRGDLWMSGAKLNGLHRSALVLQLAKIGGILMLDSRPDDVGGKGPPRRFCARGGLYFLDLRVGSSVRLLDVQVLLPSPDPVREAGAPGHHLSSFCLNGARIGGSLEIGGGRIYGQLDLCRLEINNTLYLTGVELGMVADAAEVGATIIGHSLVAKQVLMEKIQPISPGDWPGWETGSARPRLSMDLSDATLGSLTIEGSRLNDFFRASPIDCAGDVSLGTRIGGDVDLANVTIGGSLDLSELRLDGEVSTLSLKDGTIGRALRLTRISDPDGAPAQTPATEDAEESAGLTGFRMDGEIDLRDLTCDTLDDEAGRLWGRQRHIKMNHFIYRQANWHASDHKRRSSVERIWDWARAMLAEGLWPRDRTAAAARLMGEGDYWEPWQIRRNWIYQQFHTDRPLFSISRHAIRRFEYRPQPFEQAIRVARAEGREDFATRFEMQKEAIEWRLFNRRVRWPLAFFAIVAAWLWLVHQGGWDLLSFAMLLAILGLMTIISWIRSASESLLPNAPSWVHGTLMWLTFVVPPAVVYFGAGWADNPLHFFISMFIFAGLRLVAWLAHGVMRFMFGYLRRPLRAIATLIGAFLVGWAGVHATNVRDLMVIDTAPVASLVEEGYRVGSPTGGPVVRDLPCRKTISEPLYALDVLIPLIDLREESSCKVGRAVTAGAAPSGPAPDGGIAGLVRALPALTVNSEGFWAVMKALYAIAGWFMVSLAILTFAQANRTRAEPSS